eukprot:44714-Pelagomonas_calceolata.AAC.1
MAGMGSWLGGRSLFTTWIVCAYWMGEVWGIHGSQLDALGREWPAGLVDGGLVRRLYAVSPGNALVCCASTRPDILGSGRDLTHWQR